MNLQSPEQSKSNLFDNVDALWINTLQSKKEFNQLRVQVKSLPCLTTGKNDIKITKRWITKSNFM